MSKKAIQQLQREYCRDKCKLHSCWDCYISEAIEAMEKQIAKEPSFEDGETLRCPSCNKEVHNKENQNYTYCPWCGQLLLWNREHCDLLKTVYGDMKFTEEDKR